MKKFNDNFLVEITEIIKDNNLKSQFNSIINLQSKMEFKKMKKKSEIVEKPENEIISCNNEIIEQINNDNGNNNKDNNNRDNNDIQTNNLPKDKYENFNLSKVYISKEFTTKNDVLKLLVLKDKRILSQQEYYDDDGDSFYKLCTYSTQNGFICDINIDFENVSNFYLMDDGNLVVNEEKLKIIKINKNSIEVIYNHEKMVKCIKKLSSDLFLVTTRASDLPKKAELYSLAKIKYNKELYKYEKMKINL